MTEQELRTIEAHATAGSIAPEQTLQLVAEVRMLQKLVLDLRDDMRSLARVWEETRHQ